MKMPVKLTIITVSYNNVVLLERTIKNVLAVAPPDTDYIIVDGNSTDGSAQLIANYSVKLKYWVSEPDKGVYDAMNKGWRQADKNSYILYLGCGDFLLRMPAAESFEKGDIIAGTVQIGEKFLYQPKTDFRLKLGNTLHHQALFVKKSLHSMPPFDLFFKTYADFDFNQRLLKAGHRMVIDPQFKSYADENGVSAKFDKKQSLDVVKKNFGPVYRMLAVLYYLVRHEI